MRTITYRHNKYNHANAKNTNEALVKPSTDPERQQEYSVKDKDQQEPANNFSFSILSEKRKALFEPLEPVNNVNGKRPSADSLLPPPDFESASYPKGWLIGKKRKLVNVDVVESMRRIAVQEMNRKDREIDGLNEQLEEDARSALFQFGFTTSDHDFALFLRRSSFGIIILLLYVDDMIITGDDIIGISDLQDYLCQHFEMKSLGQLHYFLGLEIFDSSDGFYSSQAKYASDLLAWAGLADCQTASSPLDYDVRLTPLDGSLLEDPTLYRQLVGSLIYLTVTWPDIAHAVHIVSQFMAAPLTTHHSAVLHILRYVKGTLLYGLHFSAHSSLTLSGYSDADWAGDPTDRRSITGYCFFLGDSLVSWRSKK
ncbi:Unknown protein [Striga hermonthica]|uniref:Reverse transcriptase Ty1/copia-type domain-containing protein n=1 Tax=Striga hermonthica TaxID=68872 RepID=A0A9N7MCB4_STRHE|nr:Unknown protein [Striga hermonthica]